MDLFKIADAFQSPTINEKQMENLQFALGEPVTLGFLPFFTHGDTSDGITTGASTMEESIFFPLNDKSVWDNWSQWYRKALHGGDETAEVRQTFETDEERRKASLDLLTEETVQRHRTVSST